VAGSVKRGDVEIVAERGALTSKPRPAVVVQSDDAPLDARRVTVAVITTTGIDAPLVRIPVLPDNDNGLQRPSRIMTDRVTTIEKSSVHRIIGSIHPTTMRSVDDALRRWLAL